MPTESTMWFRIVVGIGAGTILLCVLLRAAVPAAAAASAPDTVFPSAVLLPVSLAAVWSMEAHSTLADNTEARRVAKMTVTLFCYMWMYVALVNRGLVFMSFVTCFVQESAGLLLFFLVLGQCAGGDVRWTRYHAALLVPFGTTLLFRSECRPDVHTRLAYLQCPDSCRPIFHWYFLLSFCVRIGALHACVRARWVDEHTRRRLICVTALHLATYIVTMLEPRLLRGASPADTMALEWLVVEMLYITTPLAIVHLMSLSQTRAKQASLALEVAVADVRRSEALARSRTELLQYIGHEVRVPLNSITLGLAELEATEQQRSGGTPSALLSDIRLLESAAIAMKLVLDGTLDVEKLANGNFELNLSSFDVRQMIARAVRIMEPSARGKYITMSWHAKEDVPTFITADEVRLSQVILNLVSNAIKAVATRAHGVITVAVYVAGPNCAVGSPEYPYSQELERSKDPPQTANSSPADDENLDTGGLVRRNNVQLCIAVSDNGRGITAGDQQKLFQAFQQVGAKQHRSEGTGLGLYFCHQMVRAHGGCLAVHSQVDEGATFTVTLPLVVPDDAYVEASHGTFGHFGIPSPSQAYRKHSATLSAGSIESEISSTSPLSAKRNHPSHVIIADDSITTRRFLLRALRRHMPTLEFVEADSGTSAVQFVKDHPGDLHAVCLDKNMPGMDGLQAAVEIRRMGYGGRLIGFTGEAEPEAAKAFKAAGLDTILKKPFEIEALVAAIKQ